jgi:hypothetical protein
MVNKITFSEGKQVVIGTKINTPVNMPVFIFASIWPSWLTAAESLAFKEIAIHVEDASKQTKDLLHKGLANGYRIMTKEDWLRAVQVCISGSNPRKCLVLIQGAESTVLKVCKRIEECSDIGTDPDKVWIIAGFTNGMPNAKKFEGRARRRGAKRQRICATMSTEKAF